MARRSDPAKVAQWKACVAKFQRSGLTPRTLVIYWLTSQSMGIRESPPTNYDSGLRFSRIPARIPTHFVRRVSATQSHGACFQFEHRLMR